MVFLLGSGTRIPNIVARILYSMSSRDGTGDQEAEDLVRFLNSTELGIQCRIVKGAAFTPSMLKNALARGSCVVADSISGRHSVLVIGREADELLIFDPDWENVRKRPRGKPGRYECVLDEPLYNTRVYIEEFFKRRLDRFSMGAVSERYGIIMSRKNVKNA